jgi:predicted nucleic acid-binding protein
LVYTDIYQERGDEPSELAQGLLAELGSGHAGSRGADLRLDLEPAGGPIAERDLLIASIASARGLTVVTHNLSEFARVPRLKTEDWL